MRALIVSATLALALVGAVPAGAASLFYIRGGGYGHGIGMSQYGAYGFALHGKDYRWILAHYFEGTTIGQTDPNQVVRVLIGVGQASFSGATRAVGPAAGQKPKALDSGATYSVRPLASGQLGLFDPHGKRVYASAPPLTVSGSTPLLLAGHGPYRGSLEFRPSGSSVQTVEAVDLEDYVRGVVSAEMPASWAPEALRAQAVAARTYAITTDVGGNGYQLYSDTRSQAYQGVAAETSATDAAVAATRGQVVTYDGHPVATFFFSSSGGYTEDVQNVWLGATPEPWLRGVPDPYDGVAGNPAHRWTVRMTMTVAARKLGSLVRGRLIGIRVTRRGVSPRVVTAQVVGTKGTVTVSGPRLQQIFGLMSTYMFFARISSSQGTPGSPGAGTPAPTGTSSGGTGASSGGTGTSSGGTGTSSGGTGTSSGGATPGAARLIAQSPFAAAARVAVVPPPPALVGSVFPARAGTRVAVQRLMRGRWRTVAHVRLTARGAYTMTIRHAGVYRVLWRGFAGPATSFPGPANPFPGPAGPVSPFAGPAAAAAGSATPFAGPAAPIAGSATPFAGPAAATAGSATPFAGPAAATAGSPTPSP